MINMCTVVHVSQNSAEKIWLVEIWADFFTESAESEKKISWNIYRRKSQHLVLAISRICYIEIADLILALSPTDYENKSSASAEVADRNVTWYVL